MAIINTLTTTNAGEDVGWERNPHPLLVGMKISATTMENSLEIPQKNQK
jgi:hypothetical protein